MKIEGFKKQFKTVAILSMCICIVFTNTARADVSDNLGSSISNKIGDLLQNSVDLLSSLTQKNSSISTSQSDFTDSLDELKDSGDTLNGKIAAMQTKTDTLEEEVNKITGGGDSSGSTSSSDSPWPPLLEHKVAGDFFASNGQFYLILSKDDTKMRVLSFTKIEDPYHGNSRPYSDWFTLLAQHSNPQYQALENGGYTVLDPSADPASPNFVLPTTNDFEHTYSTIDEGYQGIRAVIYVNNRKLLEFLIRIVGHYSSSSYGFLFLSTYDQVVYRCTTDMYSNAGALMSFFIEDSPVTEISFTGMAPAYTIVPN